MNNKDNVLLNTFPQAYLFLYPEDIQCHLLWVKQQRDPHIQHFEVKKNSQVGVNQANIEQGTAS